MHGHTYHLSSWALLSIWPFGSRVPRLTLKTGASVKACAGTPGNCELFPPHQHWFLYIEQSAMVLAAESHDWTYTASNATKCLFFSGTFSDFRKAEQWDMGDQPAPTTGWCLLFMNTAKIKAPKLWVFCQCKWTVEQSWK